MRNGRTICICVAAIGLIAANTFGQAVTLQEPTFSSMSVGTTVLVPDQGSTFLGGITRASSGQTEFGVPGLPGPLFKSRSIGQTYSSSNMYATVYIHDFDAMEKALLSTPSPSGTASATSLLPPLAGPAVHAAPAPNAANLAGQWAPPAARPTLNLADEQARRSAQQATRETEAQAYFDRGEQAEADGKPKVAKIYYQMAARRATGDLKQQALAKLDSLGGATSKLAQDQH